MYKKALPFFVLSFGALAWYDFFQPVRSIVPTSLKWKLASGLLGVFILIWAGIHFILPVRADWLSLWKKGQSAIGRWGPVLWGVSVAAFIFFFQYTSWGVIFTGRWLRLFLWFVLTEIGALLLTRSDNQWLDYPVWLAATLLSGAAFVLAKAFSWVTNYPFWLGWSEGNRMWDFSLLFGRHLYNYPAGQPVPALIDFGRQLLWGAIFLLPHPTIAQVRFWSALVFTLPLLAFGWILFYRVSRTRLWWLAGIWAFVFLYQGPIYSQLIISAILVTLAWRRPLWLAGPLVFAAAWFAQISRWTWMFAPAIWIVMLELAGAQLDERGLVPRWAWVRAAALGGFGLLGGYILPALQEMMTRAASSIPVDISGVAQKVGHQPLLWYRLWPNPTYAPGIIPGFLITIAPLVLWLLFLRQRDWHLAGLQRLLLWSAMLAFGLVGVVASTKIGGGSNLHNLDMFLIGMVFLAALSWQAGGELRLSRLDKQPMAFKIILFLLIIQPLWRAPAALAKTDLPAPTYVADALETIQNAINQATGDILFIDHRQLLTFGYVPAVPLIPDYEKKLMMDKAMGDDETYFAPYYQDLKDHRFALIISEPLRLHYQEAGKKGFAEENNAWMRWVVEPTLCYYEPLITMPDVQVQLLVPRLQPDEQYCQGLIQP